MDEGRGGRTGGVAAEVVQSRALAPPVVENQLSQPSRPGCRLGRLPSASTLDWRTLASGSDCESADVVVRHECSSSRLSHRSSESSTLAVQRRREQWRHRRELAKRSVAAISAVVMAGPPVWPASSITTSSLASPQFRERRRHVQRRAQVEAPVDQDRRDVGQLLDVGWRNALDRVAVARMSQHRDTRTTAAAAFWTRVQSGRGVDTPSLPQASSRTCPTNLDGRPRTRDSACERVSRPSSPRPALS
jgi:hypothetical protein